MKPWKEHKKFFLIFILFLCFQYTKQDDCDSTYCTNNNGISCVDTSLNPCPTNCKPKYGSSTCHDCSSIGKYYTISSDGQCLNKCIGDKIIGDSGECTDESLTETFKKIGDQYYIDTSPELSKMNCRSSACSCKTFYHFETMDGKKIYTCFETMDEAAGDNLIYYNYKTGEFFEDKCPDGFNVQKEIELSTGSSNVFRCSDKCLGSEYSSLPFKLNIKFS